ncbi:MAG TPA: hypothetical protein VFH68_05255 [Polyangia bacterium]|nr:hypothetical protein [Polyangia bacterium]
MDGGSLGDGGAGVAGQGAGGNGTGGAFPGTGGNPNFGIGGNPNFGIGGTGIGGRPGIGGFPGTGGSFSGVGGFINGAGGSSAGCAQAATQTACDANPSCYSVFIDPHDCACAPIGCCARFHHCAEGARGAQCYGGVSCALASPFCEGPYVVSYRNDCFEGCVNSMDCAPACTPGADQTCNDNPIVSALHGHCTATGTCQCASTYVLNPNTGRCL